MLDIDGGSDGELLNDMITVIDGEECKLLPIGNVALVGLRSISYL